MRIKNIIVTSDQIGCITDIIEAMGDRCDPYLSQVITKTFDRNSRKLQSEEAQDAIDRIVEDFEIDE